MSENFKIYYEDIKKNGQLPIAKTIAIESTYFIERTRARRFL